MTARVEVINNLIKTHNLTSYLELGVYDQHTYKQIVCENKTSVDLNHPADFNIATDDFFKHNKEQFDLIFIDADHRDFQLSKDIQNALKVATHFIVCHDVNPPDEFSQVDENRRCQTAWKAWVRFRFGVGKEFRTYCVPDDFGIGVIDVKSKRVLPDGVDLATLNYGDLERHRGFLLGF